MPFDPGAAPNSPVCCHFIQVACGGYLVYATDDVPDKGTVSETDDQSEVAADPVGVAAMAAGDQEWTGTPHRHALTGTVRSARLIGTFRSTRLTGTVRSTPSADLRLRPTVSRRAWLWWVGFPQAATASAAGRPAWTRPRSSRGPPAWSPKAMTTRHSADHVSDHVDVSAANASLVSSARMSSSGTCLPWIDQWYTSSFTAPMKAIAVRL